ncbi:F0F1 ATP synthase subunit A [Marinoscillum furvescens]|uniref:ATP synthase subunit a n=1 Tax=Marinoscillum furvescens DSM 4134 TaxID=1122208 RepID=A0A3D9L4F8_MARFU|nr:F0F1 ATP synthase subunit A [Marinoscillum furvescens]REE00505.1 ATP synthase F0 subcomplex A subunit [Marinoscillum furvescens DSM 4134]
MEFNQRNTLSKFLKFSSLFTLVLLLAVAPVKAAGGGGEEGDFDPSAMINHHIMDAHSWEIMHGVVVHLPVIVYSEEKGLDVFSSANFYDEDHNVVPYNGYVMDHEHISLASGEHVLDFSITKNVLFLFINALVMIMIFMAVARGYKKNAGKAPKGIQSFFEPIIIYVRDEIVKPNIGPKYEKYLPYLLTLFFFIWFGNLLGLLPAAANLTGNIAVTLVLAIFSLLITLVSGNKNYWGHIFDPLGNSMPWIAKFPLYIILWPIEIIGIFTKPFSLMVRLFANITAGHIIILSILSLTFIAQSIAVGIGATIFATVMNMLELFVALLQAYVFTLLTAMYFGQAVEEHH